MSTPSAPRERLRAAFDACPDPYVHNYMKAFGDKYLDAVSAVSEIAPSGETPRTDALHARSSGDQPYGAMRDLARQLERQLTARSQDWADEKRMREEAEAEVAALKRDAERYRWLRRNCDYLWGRYVGRHHDNSTLNDFDAAIDAARGKA